MMDAEFGLTALLALAMAELQSKGLNCHQMVSSMRKEQGERRENPYNFSVQTY